MVPPGMPFFRDLQGGGTKKWKAYAVHTVDDQEPVYRHYGR